MELASLRNKQIPKLKDFLVIKFQINLLFPILVDLIEQTLDYSMNNPWKTLLPFVFNEQTSENNVIVFNEQTHENNVVVSMSKPWKLWNVDESGTGLVGHRV